MAIQAFATVDDLLAGWPNKTLNESETTAAGALLDRATAQLMAMLAKRRIAIDPEDDVQAANLKTVTVNMVRRSMSSGDNEGLSSVSQTVGSTVASVQFSNPNGAFYLSAMDKETLGLSGKGGRAGFTPLGSDCGHRCEREGTCHCH